MNYMKEILSQLKIRPGMFLGNSNVDNLYAFINGYMYRIFQEDDTIPEFYPGFQKYIEEEYNVKTGLHWTKILDFYSDNEEEAMKKFFFHLDEFTKIEESNSKK